MLCTGCADKEREKNQGHQLGSYHNSSLDGIGRNRKALESLEAMKKTS